MSVYEYRPKFPASKSMRNSAIAEKTRDAFAQYTIFSQVAV